MNLVHTRGQWTAARSAESDNGLKLAFVDFSEVFNKVSHAQLLMKMDLLEIWSHTLWWVTNFLVNRTFCVQIQGKRSSLRSVNSGVPQGTVSDPTLFLIYIDSLHQSWEFSFLAYADDVDIWSEATSSFHNSIPFLQKDLNNLYSWSSRRQLPVDATLSKHSHLGRVVNASALNNDGHQLRISSSAHDLKTS